MSIWTPIRPAILDKTNPLTRGLVGYWPMVAGTGGIIADVSGYGNHGTINGGNLWYPGKAGLGHCLDFNGSGSGDYVSIANESNFDFDYTDPFSIIFWAKGNPGDTSIAMLVCKSSDGGLKNINIIVNYRYSANVAGHLSFSLSNTWASNWIQTDTQYSGATKINDGSWHHYAFTYDGSGDSEQLLIYEDGIAIDNLNDRGTISSSALNNEPVTFAARSGGSPTYDEIFNGQMDDVAIFKRALSAAEIQSLYREPLQLLWTPRSKGWISHVDAGAVTVSPDALNFVAASTISDTILGSTAATPTASSFVLSSVAPGVVLGNLTISPTAVSGILSSVDPSVVFGSITVSPAALSAVLASIDPTVVQGSTTATPTALSTILSSVDPTVDLGGIVVSPTALSAILSGTDPTTVLGDITVGPAALSAVLASIDPTAIGGGVTVAPTPSSAVLASVDPSTLYGSTTATPAASFLILSKTDPSVILGSISVTPDFVNMVMSKSDPTVSIEDIVAHTMALAMGANF